MNKMKKIWFKSAFLAMVGMSMTSCGDFLDIYPLTMVYEDNYWNEKNDVDHPVSGGLHGRGWKHPLFSPQNRQQ